MLRFVTFLAFTSVVSACASFFDFRPLNDSELSRFETNDQSAILIIDTIEAWGCYDVWIDIVRVSDRKRYRKFDSSAQKEDQNQPAMFVVQPGSYRLDRLECVNLGVNTLTVTAAHHWIEPISVSAGEIVYGGTITPSIISTGPYASLKFYTGWTDWRPFRFAAYEMIDQSEYINEQVSTIYPQFDGKITTRLAENGMEKSEFRNTLWSILQAVDPEDLLEENRSLINKMWKETALSEGKSLWRFLDPIRPPKVIKY